MYCRFRDRSIIQHGIAAVAAACKAVALVTVAVPVGLSGVRARCCQCHGTAYSPTLPISEAARPGAQTGGVAAGLRLTAP